MNIELHRAALHTFPWIHGLYEQVLLLQVLLGLLLMLLQHVPLHVILLPRLRIYLDFVCWSSFHVYFLTRFLSKRSTEPALNRGNIFCCSISSRYVKDIGLQPFLIEVGWLAMLLLRDELSRHLLVCMTL